MQLFITSLNSGSNGNCYYIGNDDEAILVDAGISCRETEKRMARLGLSMSRVKAIFISHEHGDHITGLTGLSRKYNLPVFITSSTLASSRLPLSPELINPFHAGIAVRVGALEVLPFVKNHDAIDPHSFVVSYNNIHIGVFTDIGYCCTEVIRHFSICHAVFLESNYCDRMLESGNYPYHLKKRISGDNGHLSNAQALRLFLENRAPHLSHLILAHLSKNNNEPGLVARLFNQHAGQTTVVVASRYQETPVYTIYPTTNISISLPEPLTTVSTIATTLAVTKNARRANRISPNQLTLF